MLLFISAMNRKIMLLASGALLAVGGAGLWLTAPPLRAQLDAPPQDSRQGNLAPPAQNAANALFGEGEAGNAALVGETRALLVMQNGKIIYERYAKGFDRDTKLISWSMAKSITAVLTGLMVSDGKLALDEPAPVPVWQRSGDPRGHITVRHLLHMASGLKHIENADLVYDSDTVRMLFGQGADNMAAYAETQPAIAKPDEQFNYSTATSVILSDILTRTLTESEDPATRQQAMLDYVHGRLSEPLGMASLTPEFDASGTMIGGSILHATARDYAKFGEFLRNRGVVNGQRLLPESWINFMLTSSPADGGYGGHIWLNKPRPAGANPALWPSQGPADLFACLGHQGQYIIVSPSQGLTIVRLGISTDTQNDAVREELRKLTTAL